MREYNEFLKDLTNLVAFRSVEAPAKENMPFGEENYKALNYFLNLAKSFGFETINYDNYAGEVVFGEGEDFGIIGHLDVVPEATGWETDPYVVTIKDGKILGRGVEDDKGPMLLCLYVLKHIKEQGVKPNKKIRLIVGCNEETGWKDLEYLQSKTKLPDYGFSPDGDFPITYAEKGVYHITFYLPPFKNFDNLTGGTATNAVPSHAEITPTGDFDKTLLEKYGLKYERGKIISEGVTAHGSSPQKGKNAFKNLFLFLKDCGEDLGYFPENAFIDRQNIFGLKNPQGETTFSANIIKQTDCGYELKCDLRLPAPFSIDTLKPLFDKFGFYYSVEEKHPPFMTEKDHWLINSLLSVFEQEMGQKFSPISLGGSTFARGFKVGCAFGICHADESGGAHKAGEFIKESWIPRAYKIYYNAILNIIK